MTTPLHQPPSSDDLRRFPPANAECARMRGLMRDFVDGELDARAAGAVEEHVHGCRSCGLALARAEHELLLVKSVLPRARTQAPPGFGSEVLRRLMQEDGVEFGDVEFGDGADADADADEDAVEERIERVPFGRRIAAAASFLVSVPGSLMVSVMLLAGLALYQNLRTVSDDSAPVRIARLTIMSSADTHTMLGGKAVQLSSGDGISEDQLVWVGAKGGAIADWHDRSEGRQPAARFELGNNSAVQLRDGEPMLVNGKLAVDARRPFSFAVADGSRLELTRGEYVLSASNPLGDRWDPKSGSPADLEVSLEVKQGDGAIIYRNGEMQQLVGAGYVARYSDYAFSLTQMPSGGPERTETPVAPPLGPGSLRGSVIERSGARAVGTTVLVSYRGEKGMHSAPPVTVDQAGFFGFETGIPGAPPRCESGFAVLQIVPPAQRPELGLVAPDAYRLIANGQHVRVQKTLFVETSAEFRGRVFDDEGQPVRGARLLPLVVDELFGCVLPWPEGQATSDVAGDFVLRRLPATMPNHQSLAVAVMHPELEATVVDLPPRGSAVAALFDGTIVSPRLRPVRLHSLPVSATIEIWQDMPGLPPGAAARVYTAETNEFGVVEALPVGSGQLYLRNMSQSSPALRALVPSGSQSQASYRPAPGLPGQFAAIFECHTVVPGTSLAFANTYRHQHFATTSPTQTTLEVHFLDSLSRGLVPTAQVFALQPGGPRGRAKVRFLGFTSLGGALSYEIVSEDLGLVAIAPDGATAYASLGDLLGNESWIEVPSTGRVLIDESLRPGIGDTQQVLTVGFEPVDPVPGLQPRLHRFASDVTGWGVGELPPGDYRVTVGGQTTEVTVVPGETVVLR
ncbi:MAG: zf-HC2 domain-containing protein [Planctomycetes bacterium]|nr:zf-HC2 domain-containing protein [Planctomycetota bacterium]